VGGGGSSRAHAALVRDTEKTAACFCVHLMELQFPHKTVKLGKASVCQWRGPLSFFPTCKRISLTAQLVTGAPNDRCFLRDVHLSVDLAVKSSGTAC
jgi:hypothetical protein